MNIKSLKPDVKNIMPENELNQLRYKNEKKVIDKSNSRNYKSSYMD